MPDSIFIKRQFKIIHGKKLNLKSPESLSEKIQWLKLYDRDPILTQCADKFEVRKFVKEKAGEDILIPLVSYTDSPESILPASLPDFPVILKTNHNSGGNEIILDKNLVDYKKLHEKFRKLLKENFYHTTKEWQYKNISPRLIIIEKLLIDKDKNLPLDFKLHCMNGKVEFIQVDIDRFTNHKRNFYNINWELLPFSWCPHVNGAPIWINSDRKIERPEGLEKMIKIAEKLSGSFSYSRIDLYEFSGKVFFGEITFHHGSGNEIFTPADFDNYYGKKIVLSPL